MPSDTLPSPWREFLEELDAMLSGPVELHCIGGFVLCFFYGLPRSTADIDYYTTVPSKLNLDDLAGEGSPLAAKHKVRLHHVSVNNMPEQYTARLTQMCAGRFKNLRLLVPDPYDCILSKLERNSSKDRDDADYLFRKMKLDCDKLRDRYEKELRPYLSNEEKHDLTLKLWMELFQSPHC
jgi:Nucleotidyltransferase of unknown function (DUF6036)